MLTEDANRRLTEVGPGTPGGALLRRYWQPLCPVSDLTAERPRKRVRILGDDLVVYRGADGSYACFEEHCTHRGCSLFYGYIEGDALRCPYHGWKFAPDGRVLEQPFEPAGSTFKDKVRQPAYPVAELAGLLFVYLGPAPAPLLPRWDVLVRTDGRRSILLRPDLRCNWLQVQENTADTIHTYYLHGHMMAQRGLASPLSAYYYRPIERYEFSACAWGIEKHCFYGGEFPEEEVRPPLIFPNILRIPEGRSERIHWRVPVDDTSTRLIIVAFEPNADGTAEPPQPAVPVVVVPSDLDPSGEYRLDAFFSQDRMAWETQGAVFDRSAEHLGASDRGIVLFRKLLDEQIAIVERGGEPMALLRDPAQNELIAFTSHSINRIGAGAEARA